MVTSFSHPLPPTSAPFLQAARDRAPNEPGPAPDAISGIEVFTRSNDSV